MPRLWAEWNNIYFFISYKFDILLFICNMQITSARLRRSDVTVTSPLNSSVIMEAGMYSGVAARAAEFRNHSEMTQNVLN